MSVREMRVIRLSVGDQIGNERVTPQFHLVLDSHHLISPALVMKIRESLLDMHLVVLLRLMRQ